MGRKGKEFERETEALAGKRGRRVAYSGMFGTTKGQADNAGDVRWDMPWFNHGKGVQVECKHGYDDTKKGVMCPTCGRKLDKPIENQKSMTIYREWFDKHMGQGADLGFYPIFAMKFKFAKDSKFIVIPFGTMSKMLKDMEDMWLELEELRDEQKKRRTQKT
jgi:hypothetical protein